MGQTMSKNPSDRLDFRFGRLGFLVATFAVLLALLSPVARLLGTRGVANAPLLVLKASPWLLAGLILVVERKTPVKFWAAPLLLSLVLPALALCYDAGVLQNWWRMERSPHLIVTLLINIVLIGSFTYYARELCPRQCPECENRTMIPLRNFWGPHARTRNTRWCASCGALYWRAPGGAWNKERRRTWLDLPWKEPAKGARKPERPFDTDSRAIAPVVKSRSGVRKPLSLQRTAAENAPPQACSLCHCGAEPAAAEPQA